MALYGLQLAASSTAYADGSVTGTRLTVAAVAANNLSPKVFAHLAAPIRPGAADAVATFDHVCSPADLAEYPEDQPDVDAVPAWFRTASVDLVFRLTSEAEAAYDDLVAEAAALCAALGRVDVLAALPTVWVGTAP